MFHFKNAFLLRFLILCSITLLKLKFILLAEIIGVLGLILLVEDPLKREEKPKNRYRIMERSDFRVSRGTRFYSSIIGCSNLLIAD